MANLQAGVILPINPASKKILFKPNSLVVTATRGTAANEAIITISFRVDHANLQTSEFRITEEEFADPNGTHLAEAYFKFDSTTKNLLQVDLHNASVKQVASGTNPIQLDLSFTSEGGKIGGAGL